MTTFWNLTTTLEVSVRKLKENKLPWLERLLIRKTTRCVKTFMGSRIMKWVFQGENKQQAKYIAKPSAKNCRWELSFYFIETTDEA